LNLIDTQNWHSERFQWAKNLGGLSDNNIGLSIELIPWHSRTASNVTKYIINNRKSVLENIKRFSKQLPTEGLFKNTFIVRSAAFMDLLQHKDFADYFQTNETKHFILAKKGTINKPISFLSSAKFKSEHGNTDFLIFHGGSSNDMPSLDYILIGTKYNLEDFMSARTFGA
jgi:hypothetical protein